jgi:hypothetical protein
VQAPSLVPSLVDDADDAELEASTAATDGEASGSVFVADVAAPGAASSDFLSDADEAKLEEFLIEKVEFAIEA